MSGALIKSLFRVLLPRGCANGWLAMLTAYFDDSGTHDPSEVVLVAGIIGTEDQLTKLERSWKEHLDSPLCCSKSSLSRFHAHDCFQSYGEFTGWTRTETDYFRHQLRAAIIESGVSAYGAACFRKDYEELIVGDYRAVVGSPEGFCINQCFVKSIAWARANTSDPHMTMVFDDRPSSVRRYAGAVYDAFRRAEQPPPELVGHAFLSSKNVLSLQAADLVAWEFYQYAKETLINKTIGRPHKEMLHLGKNMNFDAQLADRDSIIKVRDQWEGFFRDNPEYLQPMANHFTLFDPENPDYSHLTGQPS